MPEVLDPQNNNQPTNPRYEYGYDEFGNQVSITDPLGRETDFTYNANGSQLTRTLPHRRGDDG